MAESNGDWGALESDHQQAMWDAAQRLPEPGSDPMLDRFVESKNIDIAALVRVGARLSEHGVLVFAAPGGLKFRDIPTGRRWNHIESEFRGPKIIEGTASEHEVLIIAEGETDAARLTILYPEADVALLTVGANWRSHYDHTRMAQYPQVLIGTDADAAGEAFAETMGRLIPHAQRFAPPGGDWCEAGALECPAFPDPPAARHAGELALPFIDLSGGMVGEYAQPAQMVADLIYAEGVHVFDGHPGSGKTLLVTRQAVDLTNIGRHVIWMDYEMGVPRTVQRLRDMEANPDAIRTYFHYVPWPGKVDPQHMLLAQQAWPGALIVVDSLSKALAAGGVDENSPPEVTKWQQANVTPLGSRGPVILIDHVAKAGGGSNYSRGAGSKLADADVAWRVVKEQPFKRNQQGLIKVFLNKDRGGYLPLAAGWVVGDANGGLPFAVKEVAEDEDNEPEI